jgi:lysyl-tRNA synthetase class II
VERFEVYVAGMELGNAFSELNDPDEQERRFRRQVEDGGDEAPRDVDWDYVRALAYALPPTAGMGIGIDRLVMLLTGSQSIREVILFPLLRPEAVHRADAAGGLGIGIDRLVMLLTDSHSIRDVIFFPLLRPEGHGGTAKEQAEPASGTG